MLKKVQILCCDGYGSMLWDLRSDTAEQFFKSWNTCVKLVFREVRMVSGDLRSTTCRNLRYLREVTSLEQAEKYSAWKIREYLAVKKVPENEKWRLGLITNLMELRCVKYQEVLDNKRICAMLDSLCST